MENFLWGFHETAEPSRVYISQLTPKANGELLNVLLLKSFGRKTDFHLIIEYHYKKTYPA